MYDRNRYGFIAQEVKDILPDLLSEGKDANKTLSTDYTSFIAILINAVQEQQAQIEALQAENASLKTANTKMKALKAEVNQSHTFW